MTSRMFTEMQSLNAVGSDIATVMNRAFGSALCLAAAAWIALVPALPATAQEVPDETQELATKPTALAPDQDSDARKVALPPRPTLLETPTLSEEIASGKLPPVELRVPLNPRIVDLAATGRKPGVHGGRMRWLMAREKDIRMVVYYGYARLVGYDHRYKIVPDILAGVDVKDGREFTLRLRQGHKWSDGHPFTAEDFRYWWEDVVHNEKLGGGLLPDAMLVAGQPPRFEVIDETTVRYTWQAANPAFLPALAATLPIYIAMPAHYLKQFHAKHADPQRLAAAINEAGVRKWTQLHKRMGRASRPLNPQLPTLDPWINTTEPPSTLLVLKRNPFYHRIDKNGRQLPYIDAIDMHIGSPSLVPAKTGAGDSDLQARYLSFDDYTYLKASERRGRIKVKLWEVGSGSEVALIPNLTTADPVWRKLLRDVRVRRAFSVAINRAEVNAALYYGLARASADTVLPRSPLYKEAYAKAWAQFDPNLANRLLDEAGLEERAFDGIRLLPDGRRAAIIVESPGESSTQADVLSLVKDHLRDVGIDIFLRPTQRDLFRQRAFAGQTVMSVWGGHNNAIPGPDMSPARYAPTAQDQLQWPAWGHHYETKGKNGEAPDMPEARRLLSLYKQWKLSRSSDERTQLWHEILKINAQQVYTIGIVNGAKQPVATAPNMRNVPDDGVFTFQPGGYFGVYMPDTFFFAQPNKQAANRGAVQ